MAERLRRLRRGGFTNREFDSISRRSAGFTMLAGPLNRNSWTCFIGTASNTTNATFGIDRSVTELALTGLVSMRFSQAGARPRARFAWAEMQHPLRGFQSIEGFWLDILAPCKMDDSFDGYCLT